MTWTSATVCCGYQDVSDVITVWHLNTKKLKHYTNLSSNTNTSQYDNLAFIILHAGVFYCFQYALNFIISCQIFLENDLALDGFRYNFNVNLMWMINEWMIRSSRKRYIVMWKKFEHVLKL